VSGDKTLGRARGLNSIADPADFKGSRGRRARREAPDAPEARAAERDPGRDSAHEDLQPATVQTAPSGAQTEPRGTLQAEAGSTQATPHRAVVPGLQRKRRELSVPIPVAEAVAETGINAADVVMNAYREHSDAIFNGAGGRMVAKGRQRLRLSISDAEFDKLTRLGEARGWNRSETVTVLLTVALLTPDAPE
jgi:hypothetical protein